MAEGQEATKFDELIAAQSTNVEELQKAISNYKKSPLERKTLEYLERKQKLIDNLWLTFEKADHRLRTNLPQNHGYFNQDYYRLLGEKYFDVRTLIDADLVKARTIPQPTEYNHSRNNPNTSNANAAPPQGGTLSSYAANYQKQRQIIATVRKIINETLEKSDGISLQFSSYNWAQFSNIGSMHKCFMKGYGLWQTIPYNITSMTI